MKKTTFYFSAVKQYSNAGDALINRQLLILMRTRGQVWAMRGGAPQAFISEVGLHSDELFFGSTATFLWQAIKDRLRGKNVFLVQAPGDMPGAPATLNSVARTLVTIGLSLTGIKIVQLGVSLGHLTIGQARLLAWRTKYMKFFGLRDPISMATAKEWGFRNCHPFPDLAFGIGLKARRGAEDSLHICFSFRSDQLSHGELELLLRNIKDSLSKLCVRPRVTIATQVVKDEPFAMILRDSLAEWSPKHEHSLSIDALEAIYSQVDVVLSNRLHVLLLAGLTGALPIAFANDRDNSKVIGLFKGLGLQELIFTNTEPLDLEGIIARRERLGSRFAEAASGQCHALERTFATAVGEVR